MTEDAVSSIRTLRLKVKSEAYVWLNAAAIEVNTVWNFANETSYRAARPFAGPSRWLSAFDLNKLTAGACECFQRIGSGTILEGERRVCDSSQTVQSSEASMAKELWVAPLARLGAVQGGAVAA
jgi:hypothetical protein